MKKIRAMLGLVIALVVAVGTLVLTVPAGVQAQNNCTGFQGIIQAHLDSQVGLTGPVWASLGGEEVLSGTFVTSDWTTYNSWARGKVGFETGGELLWSFGPDGTFTTAFVRGDYPSPPGKLGFAQFHGTLKQIRGTGRFAGASGDFAWGGPILFWALTPDPYGPAEAHWNAEIDGKVCNVLPRQ
jgi:hypothetical protein